MATIETRIRIMAISGHVHGAIIALVASDGTHIDGSTEADGIATLRVPDDGETRTVFVAHDSHPGIVRDQYRPKSGSVDDLPFEPRPNVGSVLFPNGTGCIPGLEGSMNPILDPFERTYVYGDNLSFEGSPHQPFAFRVNKPFKVTDAHRNRFELTVLGIIGRTSLLDFRRL
jgi:hypothetical protein